MTENASTYLDEHDFTINEQSDSFIKAHRKGLHERLIVYAEKVEGEGIWRAFAMSAGDDYGWWSEDAGPHAEPQAATASNVTVTYAIQGAIESLADKCEVWTIAFKIKGASL